LIRYIENKNIDKKKWDHCVNSDPEAAVFFYSWFLDTVCKEWDALVAGDYEAVFPMPYKSKLGIRYIIQPFFTRTLDVCTPDKKWKDVFHFMESIPERFRLHEFCIEAPAVPEKMLSAEKKYQSLKLHSPFEKLKAEFSNNTIQNLKKAEKNKLAINTVVTARTITDDFKKIKGKELIKFGESEFITLKKLMDQCMQHGMGYTRAVMDTEGNRIASAFFMHAHNRIIYLKGSTSETGKRTGAMHFLMASLIKEYSNSDLIFDFGGSSIPSLSRFFKGFGAADHSYYAVKKNNLPLPLRWLK
jgi:hypothetical protein